MIASLLRLVLVLTLACNGFGAPVAMAHGNHAGHAEPPAAADEAAGGEDHVSQHHGHGMPGTQQSASTDAESAGCCESADCRCGCVLLSPAMSLAVAPVVRHARPGHPDATEVARLLPAALAAPFRPPSG